MKSDLDFPRPPFSNEVEVIEAEEVKARNPRYRKVRYTLRSVTAQPSPGIACSCEDSHKLGQKIVKAGPDRNRITNHGNQGVWEIESVIVKPQRWRCRHCNKRFNHVYRFVEKGRRYSNSCREMFSSVAAISSSAKAAKLYGIPLKTGYNFFFEGYLPKRKEELEKEAIRLALAQGHRLRISIDDTSIRKGHRYATYIYDATTGALLAVIEGRTYEELMAYWEQNPHLHQLNPEVVSIDRAPAYIKFAQTVFPHARIVFDRFHIIKNVRDITLQPILRETLKDKRFQPAIGDLFRDLLGRDYQGELSDQGKAVFQEMLSHSKGMRKRYEEVCQARSFYEKVAKFFPRDFVVFYRHEVHRMYTEFIDYVDRELKNKKYLRKVKSAIKNALRRRYREQLPEQERLFLERIFERANWHGLKEAYEFVEEVGRWYDTNYPTFPEAYNDLHTLIGKWMESEHKGIKKGAESLQRGQKFIANYHRGDKITNAGTEGRNCATKADFRQRYGVRVWQNYEGIAFICRNAHLLEGITTGNMGDGRAAL